MPYIGTSPSQGVRRVHTYTATANQTSFSGAGAEGATLSYKDSNFVDVYQNGVKLGDADYTATSGTAIVLGTGATVSDLVVIVAYDVFSAADTVSKADGGQFDGAVTFAGGVSGVLDADGGITVDNITIDGTEIDLSSGDLTIDVAGDIILDADGGDVILKDGGNEIGRLINDSTDFNIQCATQDKDIKFSGNDGGSGVNALILDMSDAGTAKFNHDIHIPNAGNIYFLASSGYSPIISNSSDTNSLSFFTGNNQRMNIDGNGYVTMPNQPAFYMVNTGNNSAMKQGTETVDKGGHWNNVTGNFIAPVDGTYYFYLFGQSAGNGIFYWGIQNNGSTLASWYNADSSDTYHHASCACVVNLSANDAVTGVKLGTSTTMNTGGQNGFLGYLIS